MDAVSTALRRWLRGPLDHPRWVRPAFLALIAGTGLLYLWSLDVSGYANEYYAAAAYSGSLSWTAWFFGSFDTGLFVTVGKPPLALWVTGLSVRAFGLSSWSILVPSALAGVATVAVLYRTVSRWKGPIAGLAAGAALAVTPVATVMFRYNNPDAFLVLLSTAAVAVTFSAARTGSGGRLAAAGVLIGLAFLTKTTQALLVAPAVAITYLVAAPVSLVKRLQHGVAAVAAMVGAAGWWFLIAGNSDAAPIAGQTSTGSIFGYLTGYNGASRVIGASTGPGDVYGGGAGWDRLFNVAVAGQASWLLPAAVIVLCVGLWSRRGTPRTDAERAGWILWGSVLVVNVVVFSMMSGVFHPYYTMTMVPAVAAIAGAGAVTLVRLQRARRTAWLLPVTVSVTAVWSAVLLARTPEFLPGLWTVILVLGLGAALVSAWRDHDRRSLRATALVVAAAVALAGPVAYSIDAVHTAYSGSNPVAGPTGGSEQVVTPSMWTPDLVDYLLANQADERWIVASVSTATAESLILATGEPVMALGGYRAADPIPTSSELAAFIERGELRFVVLPDTARYPGWARVVGDACSAVAPDTHGASAEQGFTLYDCRG